MSQLLIILDGLINRSERDIEETHRSTKVSDMGARLAVQWEKGYQSGLKRAIELIKKTEENDNTRRIEEVRIVTGKQIGRASCRERVCLYV